MQHILLLASQSMSRQKLLSDAQIPYTVIEQSADETACDWGMPFRQLLEQIALEKMKHAIMPSLSQESVCFVLTADTMGIDAQGVVHGKPTDKADAIAKIKALREGGRVGTAFCLDRNRFEKGQWVLEDRVTQVIMTDYVFDIPDEDIEKYLQAVPRYLEIAGALTVEGYGAQFLKSINGSYSSIIGLPMFEVREVLTQLRFF